jgi:hypothetical protein
VHSERGWAVMPQNSAEPLVYDGLEYAALTVRLNAIVVWALSVVDIANVRGELVAASQDIRDTELARRSGPTESEFRARAAFYPQSARRPRRVLLISSRRSSIVIESPRGAWTCK